MRSGSGRAGRRHRRTRRLLALAVLAAAAWAVRDVPAALGGKPRGPRAARVHRSPQFRGGTFQNPITTRIVLADTGRNTLRELLFADHRRRPASTVPIRTPTTTAPTSASASELNILWYGHASTLIEIEGRRVLVDPVWSERCSPSRLVGPRRLHPPPVPVEQLPGVDAILISHDHYDHLDMATVKTLCRTQSAPFLVPLGVGAHLDRWGVPERRIIELDWEESVTLAGLRLTATAARHFSGRGLARDRTLWGSWVVAGPTRRVFYTGDSGYFEGYTAIGTTHGPFDATLMQVGAYDPAWPNVHMFPEDAVSAHLDLRGGLLIPVHWATFDLAAHSWADPVERLWQEATARDVRLAVPRPGERVAVDDPPPVDGWWQAVA
ncbi:MBL fold metallo-hydrolase [Micromonospora polyrhachis]|uniref:L-ascorbate metabolism protein UlaG (Beta-lactamase superfamily) n=1 Tax=Micromonospora polyrhachis TaxID=1282883 RepID=A0A7W7SL06_9ACTN|nr:MBL fold metallo-hydrolase [Micromonospora polyrhachis]MBB4956722.1 L-ascorbate metabolism protein UlaG (beta-lactamase superfamily) [Micromonospora polyrhachis]